MDVLIDIQIDKTAPELLHDPSLALSQRYDYMKILSRTYGHTLLFAKQFVDGALTHVLPFTVIQNPLLGKKIVSMPFDGSYGDAICIKKCDLSRKIYNFLLRYAVDHDIMSVEIRTRNPHYTLLEDMGFVKNISLMISEIPLDRVKDNRPLQRKKRSSLHISQVKGLEVSLSTDMRDLKRFYHIMSVNMRAYGTPMYPYSYFKNIGYAFFQTGDAVLIKSAYQGKMIGGILFFGGQEVSILKYSAALPEYLFARPYAAMNWKAIDLCIEHGCRALNMGTSFVDDTGLIHAKKGFGADTIPLAAYTWFAKKSAAPLSELQAKYKKLIQLWKYQPLITTQLLGNIFWRWFC